MRYPPNPGGNFPPGCCWCVKKDHISTFTTPLLTTNVISALLLNLWAGQAHTVFLWVVILISLVLFWSILCNVLIFRNRSLILLYFLLKVSVTIVEYTFLMIFLLDCRTKTCTLDKDCIGEGGSNGCPTEGSFKTACCKDSPFRSRQAHCPGSSS